jgi:PilZ domain
MNDSRQDARQRLPKRDDISLAECRRERSLVVNFGLGGLYIRTAEPPPAGTYIQLLFDVPAGEVRARAVVQRSQAKKGMGVKIVAMQQDDRARFAGWLKHLSIQGNLYERN